MIGVAFSLDLLNFHEFEGVTEAFDFPGQDSVGDRSCVGFLDLV